MAPGDRNEPEPKRPRTKLVGYDNFKRHNPLSDKFEVHRFHHLEFWCSDASNTYRRFAHGLGMKLVASSDQSSGNHTYTSYVVQSNDVTWAFTAPLSKKALELTSTSPPLPNYDQDEARAFITRHGLAVRAVGLEVADASAAYHQAVANGAAGVCEPSTLHDAEDGSTMVVSEVRLYGPESDVVLRFVSGDQRGAFLPGYRSASSEHPTFGISRMDHVVGNVPALLDTVDYVSGFSGFHEFAEFVAEDVGTVDSGLNSMVLANNTETVLLPVNEPTFGTKRKSQIQTYLEQNEGSGVQHIALKTDDIFVTLREMRARTLSGGLDFMPKPSDNYYRTIKERIGADTLSDAQLAECEELGILVDRDHAGTLLQIFTKPLGDRPTVFVEIIQRLGCMLPVKELPQVTKMSPKVLESIQKDDLAQLPGCGGFGKGNFKELFKSIEDYEKSLENHSC